MAEVTVKQLAQVVNTPVEKLLEQLRDAGVSKQSETDPITDDEKGTLLSHLQQQRAGRAPGATGKKKLTIKRRSREIKTDSSGRKKVSVEVRTKRARIDAAPLDEAAAPGASEASPETADAVAVADAAAIEAAAAAADASDALATAAADTVDPAVEAPETSDVDTEVAESETAAIDAGVSESDAAAQNATDQAEAAAPDPADSTVVDSVADATPDADAASSAASAAAAEAEARAVAEAARAQRSAASAPAAPAKSAPAAPAAPAAPINRKRLELEAKRDQLAELERKRVQAVAAQQSQDTARSKAEEQAVRQAALEQRRETEERLRREREEREARRAAEDAQRRAALEAQEAAARQTQKGAGPNKRGKGKAAPDTRYGRNQLHVAKDKSGRRKSKGRRSLAVNFETKHTFERPTAPVVRDVAVPDTITVADLANRMAVKAAEVIKTMMGMGVMATINQVLDQDTAILVVEEMGHNANPVGRDDMESALAEKLTVATDGETLPRPPVVTVMGHVDHGKTSLLDYIRKERVVSAEAGGITQHIGAYNVQTDNGNITFLDTPGHAAFTAMRARGAQATDIVILVVAADDGVMPQTIEAIQHARAAGVPVVVAVNKMDKDDADPERVRNELSQHDVISEEWGGDTLFCPVSAHTGEGVEALLDGLLLQAELLELRATHEGTARGVVVEASLDKGRGPVATVLVQDGILKKGDVLICGQETGRVRAMFDDLGASIDEAGPSVPVQILGLSGTPNAGDEMQTASDEKTARELAELRRGRQRDEELAGRGPTRLEDVFSKISGAGTPSLELVIKADVKGSFEAIRDSLEKLSTDEVNIRVIGGGVGGITESDANLAAASNAILVGFNTRADSKARKLVTEHDIDLRYYSVIYELIDLVKQVAGGLLAPEVKERIIGLAEVRDVFRSPRFGQIAGCIVVDGVVRREEPIRVLRENVVIYEGELESLRRFKDDVKEVNMGTECGIGVKDYTDVKVGDQIEVFERTEVARTL